MSSQILFKFQANPLIVELFDKFLAILTAIFFPRNILKNFQVICCDLCGNSWKILQQEFGRVGGGREEKFNSE